MFRDENRIFYTSGSGGNHTETLIRPKKSSEIRRELQDKINKIKFLLRHAGPAISKEDLEMHREKLRKLERQLANLSATQTHKIKKTYKKISQEKIREYVMSQINKAKANGEWFITAEDIAHQLSVKPHSVKQVLQQLNIEGILNQPYHHIPHDSNRDPWSSGGGYHGWGADIYTFRNREEEKGND